MNDRKILGRVARGTATPNWTVALSANPRRLTLTFAGAVGQYNVYFGATADQTNQLLLNAGTSTTVTFTRETLGNLIGMDIWVIGQNVGYSIIETWEG
jgi:hypothetical protein